MVYDLDEIAGISDIGGGEEISYEDEEASEVALSTAMVGEQFNPSKLEGKVMVDVLMDDVSCYTFPLDQLRINSNFGWRRGRYTQVLTLTSRSAIMSMLPSTEP